MLSCRRWPDASGCSGYRWCVSATAATGDTATDDVAVEAALEIRLDGEPFSVTMRTPGADRELAAGFLFTEGIIRGSPTSWRARRRSPTSSTSC